VTDGQLLLLILWLVYVTDCFVWLDKHSVMMITWWGRKWKALTASPHFGSSSGGAVILNPISPFGSFCLTRLLPVSISPERIFAYNSQTVADGGRPQQTAQAFSFSEISGVSTRETELLINGQAFCDLRDHEAAQNLARLIEQLRQAPTERRQVLIREFWAHRLDLNIVREKIEQGMNGIVGLRFSCAVLFCILYAVIPFSAFHYGVTRLIVPGAIGMVLLAIPITFEYYSIHRRRYPLLKSDRMTHAIKMMLCPPVAIRAPDLLMAKAVSSLDSLALASVLLRGSMRKRFITRYIRDMQHPLAPEHDAEALTATCMWQNNAIIEAASKHIPDVELILKELSIGPVRDSEASKTYCPRCFVQLTVTEGTCPDCFGVPLKPFRDSVQTVTESEQ